MGSTEGPPRDAGPPRRSVRDITNAIEPELEILLIRTEIFESHDQAKAWFALSQRRTVPAQPSTRRA